MADKLTRVGIAAILTALIAGAPAMAAGIDGKERERRETRDGRLTVTKNDDLVVFYYRDAGSGKGIVAYADPSAALVAVEGLEVQLAGGKGAENSVRVSWGGYQVELPADAALLASQPELLEPVNALVGEWSKTIDHAALRGLQMAVGEYLARGEHGADGDLVKASSCFWESVQLVGAFLITTAACMSGILLACAGTFIMFLVQLNDTAEACGWCGFGRPC